MDKKTEYLSMLIEDFAILHNIYIKEASQLKQLHSVLLGTQNALESGMFDEMSDDEFQHMVQTDLEHIYNRSD